MNTSTIDKEIDKRQKNVNIRNTIIGVVITLALVIVDVFVLYTMYIGGDVNPDLARINAIIGAIVLDVIPYLLGITMAIASDAAVEERHRHKYKIAKIPLGISMAVVFALYLFIRVLIFIGGSNFNIGWQMIFGIIPWQSSADTVNPADAFSALVPFATSIASLVIGLLLYESKEKTILSMRDAYEIAKKNIDSKVDGLKAILIDESRAAWELYGENKPFPEDKIESDFVGLLHKGFRRSNFSLFESMYRTLTQTVHDSAMAAMVDASNSLADFAPVPDDVREIDVHKNEKAILDELKKIDNEAVARIEKCIKEKIGGSPDAD